MRGSSVSLLARIVAVLIALALVAAACGDDDDDTSAGDDGAADDGVDEPTEEPTEDPTEEPSDDGATSDDGTAADDGGDDSATGDDGAADGVIDVAPRSIGFLNIAGAANAAVTIQNDAQMAVEALGWSFDACDAQGDPQQMASCMTTLVQKNPDAILTMSVPPAAMIDGFEAAQEAGIPVINIGGVVPDTTGFSGEFAPDDVEMANIITQRLIDDLGGGPAEIGAFFSDANYPQGLRGEELRRMLAETEIELIAEVQSTYTNPFEESAADAEAMLRANPDIEAFWASSGSFNLAGIATTLVAMDRLDVKSYGYFCEPVLQDLIREGQITAILCVDLGKVSWDAINALVQHFENGADIASVEPLVDFRYEVLDADTIDRAPEFFEGYPETYTEAWDAEF